MNDDDNYDYNNDDYNSNNDDDNSDHNDDDNNDNSNDEDDGNWKIKKRIGKNQEGEVKLEEISVIYWSFKTINY